MNNSGLKIKTADALEFFSIKGIGGTANLARALSIQPQAISQWGEYVPELRAYKLREMHPAHFVGGK